MLLEKLQETARNRGHQAALLCGGTKMSYAQLWICARSIADALRTRGVGSGDRVGLLGDRTAEDFVHLLGIWLAGAAYVPLNHKFPGERNRHILRLADTRGVLVGPRSQKIAEALGLRCEALAIAGLRCSYCALPADNPPKPTAPGKRVADDGHLAYLLFTSGTTGVPKGVPITFDNLHHYLRNIQAVYPMRETDRLAQLADLSFDASVHEIGLCWYSGATLCVVPTDAALMWPRYAEELGVSALLAVPSSVVLAARANVLQSNRLSELRIGFLGAEALTRSTVQLMRDAAPHARLVNLWGPTEATVAFTHFPIDLADGLPETIPIGRAFAGQALALWDEGGNEVRAGEVGELVQSGSQVTSGYWRRPDLNDAKFVQQRGRRWFRTGDLARRDERFGYCYLGRTDRQVKMRGYRIELLECESMIRTLSGCDQVAVLALPRHDGDTDQDLVCCISGCDIDLPALKARLKQSLPSYMVPTRYQVLSCLPLGATGKTDYSALEEQLCESRRP